MASIQQKTDGLYSTFHVIGISEREKWALGFQPLPQIHAGVRLRSLSEDKETNVLLSQCTWAAVCPLSLMFGAKSIFLARAEGVFHTLEKRGIRRTSSMEVTPASSLVITGKRSQLLKPM